MTRYLVDDIQIQDAIHNAIKTQDTNPGGYDYVITSSMNVVKDVLKRLDRYKVAESDQTDNTKENAGRETDVIDYPFIRLESNELVDMICDAYRNGLGYSGVMPLEVPNQSEGADYVR